MARAHISKNWFIFVVLLALGLAACMPVTPSAPASGATPAPTEEATEEPAQATAEVTAEATEEATEEGTVEAASEENKVATLVRQMLADELAIDSNQIEIISVEAVDWPDSCLGVYSADIMCAQVITPGYRIVLAVDGQQYAYHTNSDGSFVQLFSAPEASMGDPLLTWQREGGIAGFCDGLVVDVHTCHENPFIRRGNITFRF